MIYKITINLTDENRGTVNLFKGRMGKDFIGMEADKKQRSLPQNNSLHKYCTLLAEELNNAGMDLRAVIRDEIEIPWNKDSVKSYLWKPIQKSLFQKESTTELTTGEVDKVYELLNKTVGERTGVFVPWPSEEEQALKNLTK